MAKYKIWWQSSTLIHTDPRYAQAIKEHSKRILSPDFELEVHGVDKGGLDAQYMYFEFLNNQRIIENIIIAEKKGYDAVALGCFLDPGLDEAREIVDIPVLGLAETSMPIACMYGKRFSIISPTSQQTTKRVSQLIKQYGFESRVVSSTFYKIAPEASAKAFQNPTPLIEAFMEASREAVSKGAEVIVSGCGRDILVLIEKNISEVGGTNVPILDNSGALMKTAETMIILNKISGMKVSRKGYYEAPSKEKILEAREIYGLT